VSLLRFLTNLPGIKTGDFFSLDQLVYQNDCLKIMNRFRKIHLATALIGDVALHASARKIADTLVSGGSARDKMKAKLKNRKEGLYQISCSPDDKVLPPEESMANWYFHLYHIFYFHNQICMRFF